VRRYSAPNERIFVWGEFPEIYWASGRQPATRFVHTGFITGHSGGRPAQGATPSEGLPGAYALLEQDFAAHPPALIVDTTGANIRSSRYYPLDTTRFWTTERAHYQPVATVQGAVFYRRVEG
jgi:hypothetical protein